MPNFTAWTFYVTQPVSQPLFKALPALALLPALPVVWQKTISLISSCAITETSQAGLHQPQQKREVLGCRKFLDFEDWWWLTGLTGLWGTVRSFPVPMASSSPGRYGNSLGKAQIWERRMIKTLVEARLQSGIWNNSRDSWRARADPSQSH